DGDGKQTVSFGPYDDMASAVAVDSQDRVVVAGTSFNGSNDDFVLARFDTNGTLDATFDGDGKRSIAFGPSDDQATSLAIDGLGRIVAAGATRNGPEFDTAVTRLLPDGSFDLSFNGDGKQTIPAAAIRGAYDVTVDSSNRIVAVGKHVGASA